MTGLFLAGWGVAAHQRTPGPGTHAPMARTGDRWAWHPGHGLHALRSINFRTSIHQGTSRMVHQRLLTSQG